MLLPSAARISSVARLRIAAQQSGRRHDEARRAIAALRAELFVKAALNGGQARRRSRAIRWCRRVDRLPPPQGQAGQARATSSISTVQAPHSPPSQPVLVPVRPAFPQIIEQQQIVGHRIDASTAVEGELDQSCHGLLPAHYQPAGPRAGDAETASLPPNRLGTKPIA